MVSGQLGPVRGRARRRDLRGARRPRRRAARAHQRATARWPSTDVEPRAAIDWYWRPTNQVRAVLEALAQAGVLALARRDGNIRVYDLAERLFPADLLAERPTEDEQRRHKLLSRYRAHGLLGMRGGQAGDLAGDRTDAPPSATAIATRSSRSGALVAGDVEGVKGERLVLAEELPLLDAAAGGRRPRRAGRRGVAFLAPLDPLAWDRDLLRTLFDFDYVWEVYVPAAKRRWGYYVLPLLWGDRLVGRIEPRIERRTRTLADPRRVVGGGFDPLDEAGFVDAFAPRSGPRPTLDAERIRWPRATRHAASGAGRGRDWVPGGECRIDRRRGGRLTDRRASGADGRQV